MQTTALQRRVARNAAIVAAHPSWSGIRHPELIDFPPRRFSRLDMLPIEGRRGERAAERRERANAAIVAAHPRWQGIRHAERLEFGPAQDEASARRRYLWAILRARAHLSRSEEIYERIAAVDAAVHRGSRPWSAAPRPVARVHLPSVAVERRRLPGGAHACVSAGAADVFLRLVHSRS